MTFLRLGLKAIFINFCLLANLSAAVLYEMDTRTPLHCIFSSRLQNRIMIDKGRISKIITFDEEGLSIQMEELSGQAFVLSRTSNPKEMTLSIIADTGAVQDLQVTFQDCSSQIIILKNAEVIEEDTFDLKKSCEDIAMSRVSDILDGKIPDGYFPCSICPERFCVKKSVELELINKMDGADEILYVYHVSNKGYKKATLFESEIQSVGCKWVYLESNHLKPKNKALAIISVAK